MMFYQDIKYDEIRKRLRERIRKLEISTDEKPSGVSEISTDDGLTYVAVKEGDAGDAVEIVVTEDSGVDDAVTVAGDTITVALRGKKGGSRSEATITDNSNDWAGKIVTLTPNVPNAQPEIITEGVDWTKGGDEDASATALALAITNSEIRSKVVIEVVGGPGDNEGFQFEIDRKAYVITFKTGGLGGNAADSVFVDSDPTEKGVPATATLNAGLSNADTIAELVTLMGSITGYTATDATATLGYDSVEFKADIGLTYPEAEIHTPFYNSVSTRKQRDAAPGNLRTTVEVNGANYFSAAAAGGTVTIKAEMGFLGRTAGADGNTATVTTSNSSATVEDFSGGMNPLETNVVAKLINDSPEASAKITVVEQPEMTPSATVINGFNPTATTLALMLDQKSLDIKYDPNVQWAIGTVFSLEQNKDAVNPTLYIVTNFVRWFGNYYPEILDPGHRLNRAKYTARIDFAQLNDSTKGLSRAYPAFPAAGCASRCKVFTKTFFDVEALEAEEFSGGEIAEFYAGYSIPMCLRIEGGSWETNPGMAGSVGTYIYQDPYDGPLAPAGGGGGEWTTHDGTIPWFWQEDESFSIHYAIPPDGTSMVGGVWMVAQRYPNPTTFVGGNYVNASQTGGALPSDVVWYPPNWPAPYIIACP